MNPYLIAGLAGGLTAVVLWLLVTGRTRQIDAARAQILTAIEGLRVRHGRDVGAAVAVLSTRIRKLDRDASPSATHGPVTARFRDAARAVRELAESAKSGMDDGGAAETTRERALEALADITEMDAAALLTVILARADGATLSWLADELLAAAARLEGGT